MMAITVVKGTDVNLCRQRTAIFRVSTVEAAWGQSGTGSAKHFIRGGTEEVSLNLTQLWVKLSESINCLARELNRQAAWSLPFGFTTALHLEVDTTVAWKVCRSLQSEKEHVWGSVCLQTERPLSLGSQVM